MSKQHIYELDRTAIFKKDLKRAKKRGCNIDLLNEIIEKLLCGEVLPEKYKDHALTGNYKNHRECHIEPDWLLVYRVFENTLILSLVRTGTHSDLDF
ncbi:MAG: type II toxin-antitoxin system YafQ family toxin [Oscillospiraceae bacterium]|nr:type II toxin-antitoxin system YafQ family toxin [Oscillospiraceae bacterium]